LSLTPIESGMVSGTVALTRIPDDGGRRCGKRKERIRETMEINIAKEERWEGRREASTWSRVNLK
jgi:hypothetical protein